MASGGSISFRPRGDTACCHQQLMLAAERLQFLPMRINENLELGSNATVSCRAEGRVPPRLRWSRLDDHDDGYGELPDDVYADDDGGNLYFVQVRASHAGRYECVASSEQGKINVTVSVDVVGTSPVQSSSANLHPTVSIKPHMTYMLT